MKRGRPPRGLKHLEGLEAPAEVKQRLRLILQTLTGETSVQQASAGLGVSEARFHQLRRQALDGALHALMPAGVGRPALGPDTPPQERVAELEGKVSDLEMELQAALIRTELALAMPNEMKRLIERGEKGGHARAKAWSKRAGEDDE